MNNKDNEQDICIYVYIYIFFTFNLFQYQVFDMIITAVSHKTNCGDSIKTAKVQFLISEQTPFAK